MFYKESKLKQFQESAVLSALSGNNLIVSTPVGSGKSLIYLKLSEACRVVVIQPLKALINDQHEKYGGFIYHGDSKNSQDLIEFNNSTSSLLFTTAESFLINQDKLEYDILVIDEAHTILEYQNFRDSFKIIFERELKQMILLSGSFHDDDFIYFNSVKDFQVIREDSARENIEYIYKYYDSFSSNAIKEFLPLGKMIVFVQRISEIHFIKAALHIPNSEEFHSRLSPSKKAEVIYKFKSGEIQVLFATSALSMGVDISDVRCVIHYDLPLSFSDFIQKSGRCGRDGKEAYICVLDSKHHVTKIANFLKDSETAIKSYQAIHEFLKKSLKK